MSSARYPHAAKRALDLAILAATAPIVVPVGLVCAALVLATSRGPVLFRQERIGRNGRRFVALKFRSMVDKDNPIVPDPNRITRVGAVLRRLSLDELPQMINVARGEMSVVGPRPTLPYQVANYTEQQQRRLAVLPGLTGLAQVNGRNALPWDRRIELDIEYVDNQSLLLDLKILAATGRVLLSGEGIDGHAADDPIVAGTPQSVTGPGQANVGS